MTREEALSKAIMTLIYFQAHFCKSKEAVDNTQAIIDALEQIEQEPVLDKIRVEIIDTGAYEQETKGKTEFLKGINYCLSVFDKYMKERVRNESVEVQKAY